MVIFALSGNRSRHADEACSQHFYSSTSQPVRYLIPDGTSEDCPFLGRFEDTVEHDSSDEPAKSNATTNNNINKGKKVRAYVGSTIEILFILEKVCLHWSCRNFDQWHEIYYRSTTFNLQALHFVKLTSCPNILYIYF
jgi:hypothetical protein